MVYQKKSGLTWNSGCNYYFIITNIYPADTLCERSLLCSILIDEMHQSRGLAEGDSG